MSVVAIDSFFEALAQSGLLTARQLADLKAEVGANAAGHSLQDLAAQLAERKAVTRWQAEMLLAGQTAFFLGKYKLLDELGRGGMGTVLKAEQVPLGRLVALKVMDSKLLRDKTAVARFHREIRAAAALSHPNVVTAFDADQAQNTHFLVMEFVEGESLDAVIKREGQLAPAEACEYIRQAALGLQHAHELGMAHRDIKPANLLLTRTGEGKPLVKILDLGLARFTSESREEGELTSTGQVMGTPDYIAPEQARNTKSADIRSDIYSLGCTLFRLLAGKVPFDGDNVIEKITARLMDDAPSLSTLRPEAPSALVAVVARMLARDPNARFQTPAEVAAALAPFTGATAAQSHTRAAPPVPPARHIPAQIDPAVHRFLQDLAHEAAGEETSETIATRIPQSDDGATVIQGAAAAESTAATPAARKLISQREQSRRNVRRQIVFTAGGIVATVLVAAAWWGWNKSGETIVTVEWPEDQRAGAAIELDGRTVSVPKSGPIRFAGPPGRHTIKLTRKGFLPIEEKINLERGEHRPIEPQWTATVDTVRKQELAGLRKRVSEFEKSQAAAPRDGKPAELSTVRDPAVATLRADLLDARRRLAGTAESLATAKLMSRILWPADTFEREQIDPRDLAYLGNPAPAELVGVLGNTRLKHCGLALAVAWSPDGRTLASVGDDYCLRLWDPATGYQKRAIAAAFHTIRSVAFSPDGQTVACRNGDKSVGLWEVETGREIATHSGGEFEFVAFSAHLEALVAIDHDVTIKLWNLETGAELRTIERKRGKFIEAAISNDGKLLAVATTENAIDVMNLATGEVAHTLQGHERQVGTLAFSPVEPLLASSADGEALTRLWDVTTGDLRRTIPRYGRYSLAFSPDGKRLAVGDYTVLNILDVQSGDVVQSYADDLAQTAIRSAAFSPGGETLAAAPGKAFLKLWNTSTGEEQPKHAGHRRGVNGVAVSPDGGTVASAGDDRIVRFWDLAERRELEFAVPHNTGVRSLAYSPDGKLLATGSNRKSAAVAGAMNVWKIDAGAAVQVLTEPCFDGALSVAFHPGGERLLSVPGGNQSAIAEWNVADRKQTGSLDGHRNFVWAAAYSPDGAVVVSGGSDRAVKIWDAAGGKLRYTLQGHTAEVRAVAFSPDGLLAASGGDDATVLVWDVKKGKRLRTLAGHKGTVTAVAFSPDGTSLASTGLDGTVQVWDPQDEDERALRSLQCGGAINHITWTPEGRHVVTAHAGGTICVWRLNAWSPTPATDSENDDRRVATWVLEMGGQVRVAVQEYAGYEPEVKKSDDLPKRPFQITRVFFDECPKVNNENLKMLIGLTHLRELILEDLTITDEALDLLAAFPELKLLSLSGSRKLTDDGARRLTPLTNLEALYVGYTQITDAGLEALGGLTKLEDLHVQQLDITGTSLSRFPRLKILSAGLSQVTDSGLAPIAEMTDLKSLALYNTAISDAGLAQFAGLRNLQSLSLNECPNVSDSGLEHLKEVTSLKRLSLQKTRITPSGRAAFAADHPDCVIE